MTDFMKEAQAAVDYVDNKHYTSNNRPGRNGLAEDQLDAAGSKYNMAWATQMGSMAELWDDPGSTIIAVLAPICAATQLRFANCEPRAALAFRYLARKGVAPVEMISLINDEADHTMLILGRKSGNFLDHKKWNADAIICDPWAGLCYPVAEMEMQLGRLAEEVRGKPPYQFSSPAQYAGGAWPPPELAGIFRDARFAALGEA